MEKIIHKLINEFTEGVDTYTHNGSTWLIFTESKQWVIELTDSKTLWYNYNFFKGIFSYTSIDVVDNQQYITKWVEDNIINKELTYATLFRDARDRKQQFEDTLENGVKETITSENRSRLTAENIIENGVKETKISPTHTEYGDWLDGDERLDKIIQNGVKETIECDWKIPKYVINEVVNDGVKETDYKCLLKRGEIEDIIDSGIKETIELMNELPNRVKKIIKKGVKHTQDNPFSMITNVEDAIQNGVRDTQYSAYENQSWINGVIKKGVKRTFKQKLNVDVLVKDIIQDGVKHTLNTEYMPKSMVEDIIKNGIKETNHVDVMKFFDNKMEDVLQNGVKETNYDTDNYTDDVKEVIREGVRSSTPRQYVGGDMIDKVIDKGVIETHDDVYHHKGRIDGVIKNGIKETKTPGKDGEIMSTVEWLYENKSNSYTKMINDVLDNGEKINGTYAGGQRQSEKCKSVVEYGTKKPTD